MQESFAPVLIILAVATLVRASLGFGEALIAVPLLALFMPVDRAAPLAVLVSVAIAFLIVVLDWRHVHFGSAGRLLGATLFGIPLGLLLLTRVPELAVKAILAAVLIAFAAYSFFSGRRYALEDDRWAWLFGFKAGILGGAYGMNGPPLAVYGSLRRWSPDHFRATLQAYFFPASLIGMAGFWWTGLWTAEVNGLFQRALPAVILATLAGRRLGKRIDPVRFKRYVHLGLAAIGAILLAQVIWSALR